MSVWLTIPSARPVKEVAHLVNEWHRMGYKVALQRDAKCSDEIEADLLVFQADYRGYSIACNDLIAQVMRIDPDAAWFICAGDDTFPDQTKRADEIARECRIFFALNWTSSRLFLDRVVDFINSNTFGVMQPTGDRFAGGSIDRIAGSAWIGREFVKRTYGGKGPMWHEYFHMFNDEELQEVATKLGVFWQRPDLCHLHMHFQRESADIHSDAVVKPVPDHLKLANSREFWERMKAIYDARKAAGFPGAFEAEK